MSDTFKKNKFKDRPSVNYKKDKSTKYRFRLNEFEDNIDEIVDDLSYRVYEEDYEADSSLFNSDGKRKTREQLDAEMKKLLDDEKANNT